MLLSGEDTPCRSTPERRTRQLNHAGHEPGYTKLEALFGAHCGLQSDEALVSGRMKCDRFVVTALPRQWHALAFLQDPKSTSFFS